MIAPCLRIVKAGQQGQQRGFAAAVAADDGDALALGDGQADITRAGALAPAIGEGDVFKADLAC